jgi:hypothetical protein
MADLGQGLHGTERSRQRFFRYLEVPKIARPTVTIGDTAPISLPTASTIPGGARTTTSKIVPATTAVQYRTHPLGTNNLPAIGTIEIVNAMPC